MTQLIAKEPVAPSGRGVLTLRGVGVTYPSGMCALKPVDLSFTPGEFAVLLGASGAGKSTLLRSINQLVQPSTGSVQLQGAVEQGSRAARLRALRRQCAMVFQQHHLIGRQTVLSNVLLGLVGSRPSLASLWPWSKRDRLLALGAIERVGLLDKAMFRADMLSGGQQQRVGIARALVQSPQVLLADEPVASLDPATAHSVLSLLHGICKNDGLTALVSLHQVDLAKTFADRIVGLRSGEVLFDVPAPDLSPDLQARLYGSRGASTTACAAGVEPEFFHANPFNPSLMETSP
jgi:phosphonate transport system ATP-binding protein